VAQRIYRYYRRTAEVMHPPVDTDFFQPGESQMEYFLIVSALVPYKRIDLAVETFSRSGSPLKIVGTGPEYKKLRKKAKKNIDFLGFLPPQDLLQVYQQAKALLVPCEEDFGINSLEAQACGVPVLAYGRGGATETVISGKTGLFFAELTAESLQDTLDKFQNITFNMSTIRANALRFSRNTFKEKTSGYFRQKWHDHLSRK
ncbi:MAG: glycosyltransferase, partial [Candidatus Aminicenantes bacterium]|nr:glycosyltransferase [Candidatus Aminicenantes bacterium]